uniref:Ig-like domain-containing protein n=1 Tax=Maylandia zebra TaxID=106582 RepID=A0A3P9CTD3_9CICH
MFLFFFILLFYFIYLFLGKLVSTSCPLELSPPRVVVRFGDSFSANCTSSSDQTEGMGWESPFGGVDFTQAWEIEAMCYMNSRDGDQCTKVLPVTVYNSASLKNVRTVEEGRQFAIQCDVVNVAPARNLSVVWHKGNKILSSQTFDESIHPVSKSSVLTLTAHRDDDGAEIWCEAKLNLWPDEQGPPPVRSEAHNVKVGSLPCNRKVAGSSPGLDSLGRCVLGQDTSPVAYWWWSEGRWRQCPAASVSVPQGGCGYNVACHHQCVNVCVTGCVKRFGVLRD